MNTQRNTLVEATSPYLRQHADNPVDWCGSGRRGAGGGAARTCRFCSRSATRPATGVMSWRTSRSRTKPQRRLMNDRFVYIKVDREERPDLDAVYMNATRALTGQGGWPMTCFLTPDGKPFSAAPTSRAPVWAARRVGDTLAECGGT